MLEDLNVIVLKWENTSLKMHLSQSTFEISNIKLVNVMHLNLKFPRPLIGDLF